jgi:predicted nucleic acid-binding protein
MCYLAIDTNIWLYLLKEGAESDNPLNALIHWIENQHVKILLPEIIITEWERHRDEKKNVLIQDWRDFLNRARKVFDSSYVNDLTPEFIEQQVDRQLDRVDYIFSNHAIVLPISEEVKLKSVENALHKKAPFHRKSSMADVLAP